MTSEIRSIIYMEREWTVHAMSHFSSRCLSTFWQVALLSGYILLLLILLENPSVQSYVLWKLQEKTSFLRWLKISFGRNYSTVVVFGKCNSHYLSLWLSKFHFMYFIGFFPSVCVSSAKSISTNLLLNINSGKKNK